MFSWEMLDAKSQGNQTLESPGLHCPGLTNDWTELFKALPLRAQHPWAHTTAAHTASSELTCFSAMSLLDNRLDSWL